MTEKNRSQWDLCRFIKTLTYFEVFPALNWVEKLFQSHPQDNQNQPNGGSKMGVILVAGATGGVGKRVVKRLSAQGYKVRCLVRDIEKARLIVGNDVDLVAGDITKPETLNSLVMSNIQAVICCTAVRVQPVEGDTPDRAKYNQGVKFYLPEIVGDTPENVEYKGVKNLVEAAAKYLPNTGEKAIFDFTQPSEELKNIWGALDDVVMGGVSASNFQILEKIALFAGNVSTANSGGFASVRTKNFSPPIDLSGYTGVKLRLKGDGQRYKIFLRTESTWDGVGYSYAFDTVANTWIDITIPFADLTPVFRAKSVKDCPPIDSSKVCSFQLMLSKFEYDGALNPKFNPGSFALEIESIKAFGGESLPQFVFISSAGVTRPGRPGINLDEEPPAVRLNDQLGGILTWKLRGEDSLRDSGIPYTIIRPCALTEATGGKELIFEQGDNIRGKISRDDVAEICIQSLQQPKARNLTFEVKQGENNANSMNWNQIFSSLKPDK
ncbi:CIA30 family protein [Anabaena cylindrica FACHB-243]|uniref:NADH:ubiquinone oxidoreductase complex I intermediate-associated protein 30 n=1 Tax=Anabaena cylindrica (strain ATCC 27899 / PCC 7122) TaxID=272123 RepID=K9ZLG3_ANACC|nr:MULTISPECIES: CIA30 family protein [Anabaena]AFZ60088.1 NADH:ubiquinone oxidoreductase complex I intermediate-associated protein 30 [Anabaena cylindrica PCC 7122]MBD2417856.1 CIA30 family protein [Anabaena cylindrica FACHB-243]MBY5282563.1 NAD(P)H-binding protein [Anabaena sp. CCAP 1446/1C]MBY5310716.1 NAD(P)H-binding protein [Anabaena sp. CCAP 1446/1C]MCM2404771.1 CIA30 family protein [Anabaena sp. CCAP 1446/1C]